MCQKQVTAKTITKTTVEVAHIFHDYGQKYQAKHKLPSHHRRIMSDIILCRTKHFGGHIEQCDSCGAERIFYNSCRNRHCPKCQTITKEKWIEARKSELLPIGYFHNVFTLPHELNPIARYNSKLIYTLLFSAVSQTLINLGFDTKYLGGKMGFISILHTWDQRLNLHIHLHVVIPGGALSKDTNLWLYPKKNKNFLIPVAVLSKVFRGIFIRLLKKQKENNHIHFAGNSEKFGTDDGFNTLLKKLWSNDWVVYSKKPFAGPEQVLDYLGRYTHKVAISNHRILNVKRGKVTFKYRDRKDDNKEKTTSISTDKFIGLFLQHVVPYRFMRIRHYGFLANRCKKENLEKCIQLLGVQEKQKVKYEKETTVQLIKRITGIDLTKCPFCKKGTMQTKKTFITYKDNLQIIYTKKMANNTS